MLMLKMPCPFSSLISKTALPLPILWAPAKWPFSYRSPQKTTSPLAAQGFPHWHTEPPCLEWWPAHRSLPYTLATVLWAAGCAHWVPLPPTSVPSSPPAVLATCTVEVPVCATVSEAHSDTGHQGGGFCNYGGERSQGKGQRERKRHMGSALQVAQLKCESQASQPDYWAQVQTCRRANKSLSHDNKCWKHNTTYSTADTGTADFSLGRPAATGLGTFPNVWEYNPASLGQDLPGALCPRPFCRPRKQGWGMSICFASDSSGSESDSATY